MKYAILLMFALLVGASLLAAAEDSYSWEEGATPPRDTPGRN